MWCVCCVSVVCVVYGVWYVSCVVCGVGGPVGGGMCVRGVWVWYDVSMVYVWCVSDGWCSV